MEAAAMTDDPLGPVRGCLYGLAAGLVLWAVLALLVLVFLLT
jgi:tetrahydromethanopterin S-methyltransferase subunit G